MGVRIAWKVIQTICVEWLYKSIPRCAYANAGANIYLRIIVRQVALFVGYATLPSQDISNFSRLA
jgi:hypothetical protein